MQELLFYLRSYSNIHFYPNIPPSRKVVLQVLYIVFESKVMASRFHDSLWVLFMLIVGTNIAL